VAATTQAKAPPPPFLRRARRWARENLFGSVGNTLLTVITSLILGFLLYQILRFVFVTADWSVIEANRRLLFLGRFPAGEEWRIWPPIFVISALAGLTWGLWSRLDRQMAIILAVGLALVFVFLAEGDVAILTAVSVALTGLGYVLAQARLRRSHYLAVARQLVVAGWLLTFPLAIILLVRFDGVDPSRWGGFHLNILLAVVGIIASFPLGVLLALGRTSSFPVLRVASTAYIELVRGVPLITILLMAWFVLPKFLPSFALPIFAPDGLDKMELVYRVMLAFTLFSAAYVAEAVRGGLQAVPRGQVEAAKALGLGTVATLGFIVLPQALRAVLPALVGQFISLFKDTSLVFIVGGLTDLLASGRAVTAQAEFFGRQKEALLFVGVVFWIVAFSMSRMSQRLERTLGVGER
jgi:general L-amino acid transport system permease protein